MQFFKKINIMLMMICCASMVFADNGNFYRINNTSSIRGVRGLASVLTIPATTFRYTPGTSKTGVLNDLTLVDYAISQDNSVLALAESIKLEDDMYLNRLIFFEFGALRIINGIEYQSKEKIEKIFFFADNLFCIVKGERRLLKELKLMKNPIFAGKSIILDNEIVSVTYDKNYFYLKDNDNKLMQFDEKMRMLATLETRDKGGLILMYRQKSLLHFTQKNLETIQIGTPGLFKSDFRDLKEIPSVKQAWISPVANRRSIYFTTDKGRFYELVDFAYCEELDTSSFQMATYNFYRREFYILANKRNIIEILRLPNLKTRRKMAHHTMRPESHQNLKFIIPHSRGVLLITQLGEFVFIREHKRRFYKTKL